VGSVIDQLSQLVVKVLLQQLDLGDVVAQTSLEYAICFVA